MTFVPRAAIETIQREGVPALEQMQQNQDTLYLDLTIILRWVCKCMYIPYRIISCDNASYNENITLVKYAWNLTRTYMHVHSLFEEEISHFIFPVPSTSNSSSSSISAAAIPVDSDRNVPRLSPESSRPTEHLLSSLSSTSSDVQISTLNFDLNERIERAEQHTSTVDRNNHTCKFVHRKIIIRF